MPTAEKLDILLVDDKVENLLALEAILQSPDYRLIKTSSGSEAIEYLQTHDCAIILLDVQMPEMDGFETAAVIKRNERSRNIPIIFLTAIDQDSQYVHRGYSAGAVDYLFKPLDAEILRSKVAVFAELYRTKEEIRRQAQLLQQRERRSEERLKFLAETSLALSESLDYHAALVKVGRLAVPKFADSFSFDALDEVDQIRTLASYAAPGSTETAAQRASDSDPLQAVLDAVRTGRPRLQTLLADSGFRSRIIAPVITYTRMLGAIAFERGPSREKFDEADMLLAQDLAHRIAAAIDNACLYSEAQSAIRARDEFLSIASHELRTPLTPLKIQTQLLIRRLGQGDSAQVKPETLRKIAETSDRQVERLSRLVDELLDVSRINVGRLALDLQPLSLPDVVNNVVEHFQSPGVEGQGRIEVSGNGPIVGNWDPLRLEQVVTNLLTNAIKYGSGKPIIVSMSTDGARAQLTVQDQGIGIAKQDQARIFDRFERAASSRHFGGLGLGLYITKEIISSHGGTIRVESEPGRGSTFIVDLPLTLGAPREIAQARPSPT